MNGFLHFYPGIRKAEILGDGTAKSSNATLGQVSQAVVRIFQKPEETKNRVLMIQSFCISQLDVLRSLERVTGRNGRPSTPTLMSSSRGIKRWQITATGTRSRTWSSPSG